MLDIAEINALAKSIFDRVSMRFSIAS